MSSRNGVPRQLRDQPRRDRLQVRSRVHGLRHARQPRLRPGAHERAAALSQRRTPRDAAASARSSRDPSTPTTAVLPGAGPRARHQRPQGHRGAEPAARDRRRRRARSPTSTRALRVQHVMDMFERSNADGAWVTLAPRGPSGRRPHEPRDRQPPVAAPRRLRSRRDGDHASRFAAGRPPASGSPCCSSPRASVTRVRRRGETAWLLMNGTRARCDRPCRVRFQARVAVR